MNIKRKDSFLRQQKAVPATESLFLFVIERTDFWFISLLSVNVIYLTAFDERCLLPFGQRMLFLSLKI